MVAARPLGVVGRVAAAIVALLAVLNLPSSYKHQYVDPVLERPQDLPSWWHEASAALDARRPAGGCCSCPGTEFGGEPLGHTVDPILPGLSDRQLITRDLLPLGSAGGDGPVVRARRPLPGRHDRRRRRSRRSPGCSAPTGCSTPATWRSTGSAPRGPSCRGSSTRREPKGLGTPQQFGPVQPNDPAVPMLDDRALVDPRIGEPVPQLALIPVEDAPAARARRDRLGRGGRQRRGARRRGRRGADRRQRAAALRGDRDRPGQASRPARRRRPRGRHRQQPQAGPRVARLAGRARHDRGRGCGHDRRRSGRPPPPGLPRADDRLPDPGDPGGARCTPSPPTTARPTAIGRRTGP